MKKILFILLLITSIGLSKANLLSPTGTYFLGDNIFIAGNFEGDCVGKISIYLDGSLIDENRIVQKAHYGKMVGDYIPISDYL